MNEMFPKRGKNNYKVKKTTKSLCYLIFQKAIFAKLKLNTYELLFSYQELLFISKYKIAFGTIKEFAMKKNIYFFSRFTTS